MYCEIFLSLDIKFCVFRGYNSPQIKDPNKIVIHISYIAYNLKSTNSSFNKHVHRSQTTKFRAHEIK